MAEGTEIAAYIRKMVAKGYRYQDIAILRPEVSNTGKQIAKILLDMGIPGHQCVRERRPPVW